MPHLQLIPLEHSENSGWLSLQRNSLAALRKNEYESASELARRAYHIVRRSPLNDPRILLMQELLANLAERQDDFEMALFWRVKLVKELEQLLGPCELLRMEILNLVRLYLAVGDCDKAVEYASFGRKLSECIPAQTISQSVRCNRQNYFALKLVNLVRVKDRTEFTKVS